MIMTIVMNNIPCRSLGIQFDHSRSSMKQTSNLGMNILVSSSEGLFHASIFNIIAIEILCRGIE